MPARVAGLYSIVQICPIHAVVDGRPELDPWSVFHLDVIASEAYGSGAPIEY